MYKYNDEWEEFPMTYKWNEALHFTKEKDTQVFLDAKDVAKTLIFEANTHEDMVLTTCVMYIAYKNEICAKQEIIDKFGEIVYSGIEILMQKDNENEDVYLNRIFTNNAIAYAKKIKLAEILYTIRFKDIDKNYVETIMKQIDLHSNQLHNILIRKITAELEVKKG